MLQIAIEGFLLGLSTGVYCFASCAPFLVPYALVTRKVASFTSFIAGRFIAYGVFAFVAGLAGAFAPPGFTKVSAILLVVCSLLMLVFSIFHLSLKVRFCTIWIAKGRLAGFPFLAGVLLGLNPCPPFLAGAARVMELRSIPGSLVFFFAFFIATTLCLLPALAALPFIKTDFAKRLGIYIGILSGAWFLIQGIVGVVV